MRNALKLKLNGMISVFLLKIKINYLIGVFVHIGKSEATFRCFINGVEHE